MPAPTSDSVVPSSGAAGSRRQPSPPGPSATASPSAWPSASPASRSARPPSAPGLSAWQACALSLLAFTGASQFALAGVIAGGGSLLAGTAGAILLGSRNTLYGLRLADVLRPRGPAGC